LNSFCNFENSDYNSLVSQSTPQPESQLGLQAQIDDILAMELSQDVGHRSIIFIRFNPDEYNKKGTNVTSCWGIDKKGLCMVKKSKQKLAKMTLKID
jgi:hypothetical protein